MQFLDLEHPNLNLYHNEFLATIICASLTNVATCETDPVRSRKINVTGTIPLIDLLLQSGCFEIFLSTNAFFDRGKAFATIEDVLNPITNYGSFRRQVEIHLGNLDMGCASVLRLTKVMTSEARFLVVWRELASKNQPIPAFTNTMLSLIAIEGIVSSIYNILKARESGTSQVGGLSEVSYSDFAVDYIKNNPASLALLTQPVDPSVPSSKIHYNSLRTVLPS